MIIADVAGQLAKAEVSLAKRIAEELHKAYPGYAWGVTVNRSVLNVLNLSLSGRWGFTLHITKLASDVKTAAIKAGGELLERYRQPRGRANDELILSAARDFKGDLHCDRA